VPIKKINWNKRNITRGVPRASCSSFATVARRRAIKLLAIGITRYVLFMGRKAILRILVGRSKPHAINSNFIGEIMVIKIP